MGKTGQRLKIEKIWDVEVWAVDAVYTMVMLLPSWNMRGKVMSMALGRLEAQEKWEKRAND